MSRRKQCYHTRYRSLSNGGIPKSKFGDIFKSLGVGSFGDDPCIKNIHNVPLDSEDNNEDEQRLTHGDFDGKHVVDPISGGVTIL